MRGQPRVLFRLRGDDFHFVEPVVLRPRFPADGFGLGQLLHIAEFAFPIRRARVLRAEILRRRERAAARIPRQKIHRILPCRRRLENHLARVVRHQSGQRILHALPRRIHYHDAVFFRRRIAPPPFQLRPHRVGRRFHFYDDAMRAEVSVPHLLRDFIADALRVERDGGDEK